MNTSRKRDRGTQTGRQAGRQRARRTDRQTNRGKTTMERHFRVLTLSGSSLTWPALPAAGNVNLGQLATAMVADLPVRGQPAKTPTGWPGLAVDKFAEQIGQGSTNCRIGVGSVSV